MTEKDHAPGDSRENKSFAPVQSAIRSVLDTVPASARTFLRLLVIPRRTMPSLLDGGGRQFVPSLAFLAIASFVFLVVVEAVAENIEKTDIGPDIFMKGLLSLKDSSAFDLVLRALPVFLAGVGAAALARGALARPGGQERMGRAFHYAAGVQLTTGSLLILLVSIYALVHDTYGAQGDRFINRTLRAADNLLFDRRGLLYLPLFAFVALPARTLWRAVPPEQLRRVPRSPFGRVLALAAACLLSFALAVAAALFPLLTVRWLGGGPSARLSFAAHDIDAKRYTGEVPSATILRAGDKSEIALWAVVRNDTGATLYLSRTDIRLRWRPDVGTVDHNAVEMPARIEKWSDGDSPLLAVKPGEVKWLSARADPWPHDVEWMQRTGRVNDKLYELRLLHFYPDRNDHREELSTGWAALRLTEGTAAAAPAATPGGR